jgi:hypothetical protein
MNVRPRRLTTIDPSFSFNDFSEFLTFMTAPPLLLSQKRPPTLGYSSAGVACGA